MKKKLKHEKVLEKEVDRDEIDEFFEDGQEAFD